MGAACTKRDGCSKSSPQCIPVDSNPIKIGNLIFIDYLRYTQNCCSLDLLLKIIPDCIPTEILCYSLLKDSEPQTLSYVVVVGANPDTCEELSLLIEIHENWAFIQFGEKAMIEKIRQIDHNTIEFMHNPLPKMNRIGFHAVIKHINRLIDLEIDSSHDNYGKYLYRQLKSLIG